MPQTKNIMPKHYQQLQSFERGQIESLTRLGFGVRQIASRLHRSPSTISRELKRGLTTQIDSQKHRSYQGYFAERGAAYYREQRAKCHPKGLLQRAAVFFKSLPKALKAKPRVFSVDTYVHYFKAHYPGFPCPSTATVYRYIEAGKLPELHNYDLPMKLRRRAKRPNHRHARLNKKRLGQSIEDRPAVVRKRQELGHWEGDLVKAKRVESEPALMTLTERVSRMEIIVKLPDYRAETCRQALQDTIDDYGAENFRTITFDNGSEFASLNQVQGTGIYFAHPYSPWERGTNENVNGQLRELFPKGHSFKNLSLVDLQLVQDTLNHRPRRCLSYSCPADVMPQLV
ncbi:IS30 family transposase [Levilactobacillus brevis]|uniref:IS30 family transposase n=1 Tax=Levilactobacillus brevis TaxID=1580 RepID=UPI00063AE555|nr:IS30 family transposase [Levilactobacillus brevis]KLE28850.1 transposase [Levilactobacillus brevis]